MVQLDDLMDQFAVKEIKRHYPSCEGWSIRVVSTPARDCRIFRVERKEKNVLTSFSVLASFAGTLPAESVEALGRETVVAPKAFAGRIKNVILIPLNAKTGEIPAIFRSIRMKQFSIEGKNLTWLKKPVAKTVGTPPAGV
jgi:hypothetical protein